MRNLCEDVLLCQKVKVLLVTSFGAFLVHAWVREMVVGSAVWIEVGMVRLGRQRRQWHLTMVWAEARSSGMEIAGKTVFI